MRTLLIIGATAIGMLATLATAQPAPTTRPAGASIKAEIEAKFQSLVTNIPADPSDSELRAKLKERHNSAARLLDLRLKEFQKGTRDLSGVYESARIVAESQLDLSQTQQERENYIQQAIAEAK